MLNVVCISLSSCSPTLTVGKTVSHVKFISNLWSQLPSRPYGVKKWINLYRAVVDLTLSPYREKKGVLILYYGHAVRLKQTLIQHIGVTKGEVGEPQARRMHF